MDRRLHHDAIRLVTAWPTASIEMATVRSRFLELLANHPGATRRDNPGAHLTASALVVNADHDRVLLCLHGRIGRWVQLGGHCESIDDSLAAAALREATEESGIAGLRLHPTPIDLDIHEVNCRYGSCLHYDVRFAIVAPAGAVESLSSESHALGWFAPDALPQPLADATDRLIGPALIAARDLAA